MPLLHNLARHYEARQPQKAAALYQRALSLEMPKQSLLQSAERLFATLGNWNMVAQLLEAEAKVAIRPEEIAAILYEQALVSEEKLNQSARAKELYALAHKAHPGALVAARAVVRHHLAQREFLPAYEMLDAMAAETRDAPYRADFHRQLAFLAGERLSHPEVAAAHEKAVLDRDPLDSDARATVLKELRRTKNDEALAVFLLTSAHRAGDPSEAAHRSFEAARLFLGPLNDPVRGVQALRAAVTAWPRHLLAWRELAHLYERLGQWAELVEAHRLEAAELQDLDERVGRYFKIGQIYEERLNDPVKAADFYQQVVLARPTFLPALQALGRSYFKNGQWAELAEMYEAEILATEEPELKVPKLFKLAEIVETRVADVPRTIVLYQRILELDPTYLPAMQALSRIYAQAGRFANLVEMYEHELAISDDLEQKLLLLGTIGQTYEQKLQDTPHALDAYQRALTLHPGHLPTLRTLGRLYMEGGRWHDFILVNETEADLANDQKQVIALLHKNGEVYEDMLGDKERAITTYQKVLTLMPNYLPALKSLGRLYLQTQRYEDLAQMYRQEVEVTRHSTQAAMLAFKAGEVYEEKLHDAARAIASYHEVLAIDPTYRQALVGLARLLEQSGDWAELAKTFERYAETTSDAEQQAVYWFKNGEIREEKLADPIGAITAYRAAYDRAPSATPALSMLARLYEEKSEWKSLTELLALEAAPGQPAHRQVAALLRLGSLHAGVLDDAKAAVEAYERALELAPGSEHALLALSRLYVQRKLYSRAVEVLEKLAQRCLDNALKVALELEAAAIKEQKLDPPVPATVNYERVLGVDPSHPIAVRRLMWLVRGDPLRLDVVFRAAMVHASPEHRAALLVERAELAVSAAASTPELAEELEALVGDRTDDLVALRALSSVYRQLGRWPEYLRAVERESKATADNELAVSLLLDIARVYERELKDGAAARRLYQEALSRAPQNDVAFSALSEVLREHQQWGALADLLEARTGDNGEAAAEAGRIALEHLNDVERAQRILSSAAGHGQQNAASEMLLAALAVRQNDTVAAIDHFARALSLEQSPDKQARIHGSLASLYGAAGDNMRALMHARTALQLAPNDPVLLTQGAEIFQAQGDTAATREVLQRLTQVLPDDQRAEAFVRLGQVLDEQGDTDAARAALEQALAGGANDALAPLRRLYEASGDWAKLAGVLESLATRVRGREAQTELAFRIGQLYAGPLANPERAVEWLRRASGLAPESADVEQALLSALARSPATQGEAMRIVRERIAADPLAVGAWRALRQIALTEKREDMAFGAAEALVLFKAATPEEQQHFALRRDEVPQSSDAQLGDSDHDAVILDDELRGPIAAIFALLTDQLAKIYPSDLSALEPNAKSAAKSIDAIRVVVDEVAHVLVVPPYAVTQTTVQPLMVHADNGEPLQLVVGNEFLRRTPAKEQRFILARALESFRTGQHLFHHIQEEELAVFLEAVVMAVQPDYEPAASFDSVDALAKQLRGTLSRKTKKALEEPVRMLLDEHQALDPERIVRAAERTALRAAVSMTNDLEAAIRVIAKEAGAPMPAALASTDDMRSSYVGLPQMGIVLSYWASDEYWLVRKKLGFGFGT